MYEISVTLALPFETAVDKVREVLMSEHLGVVSEVDVQAIMQNKLGETISAYRIFGACNPGLAKRVIEAEPNAGTLLPCNFVVREGDGGVVVSFMDPVTVLGLAASDEVKAVATDAKAILDRVLDKLGGL